MATRVLVVDDYAPWRRFTNRTLQQVPNCEIIAEASDGFAAVQRAQEFQPDLILLDIGLPGLNGIEAARRIRTCSPQSKILIISAQRTPEIVQEAFRVGAHGYVLKSHARQDLIPALNIVLAGERFVSISLGLKTMKCVAPQFVEPLPEAIPRGEQFRPSQPQNLDS